MHKQLHVRGWSWARGMHACIYLVIKNDNVTSLCPQLLKGVTISQGGVLPHIPEVLLFRKSQMRKSTKPRPTKAVPAAQAATSK